ncbi:hypothetical protein TrST_g9176 [Triparma strigata]|uniref:Uncharacterized protein n=1 Tax=Triparma strigata TaxID=1606541 RepID=A0A9W7EDK9_9STRA|nr:hypothetical protein TrST_g9176 [Triparma strigata]
MERDRVLLLTGGLGGPFTIMLYCPLRNAIALGSKYPLNAMGLYRMTFARGFAGGWTGGLSPTIFSCPQFLAMGPLYHVYSGYTGPTLAVLPTAITESTISFGSQARNAQLAFNATVEKGAKIALQNPANPIHIGVFPHIMRNVCAMSGIRILNEPCSSIIASVTRTDKKSTMTANLGAFLASCLSAGISMPFNQIFNYLAITPEAGLRDVGRFLKSQYVQDGSISPRMLRDLGMRIAYNAPQLTTFLIIEKAVLKYFGH